MSSEGACALLRCSPWSHGVQSSGAALVCSAGPAGCFHKGGDPLRRAHRLTARGHVVNATRVTAQCVRHAGARVGPGAAAGGPFLRPLSEFSLPFAVSPSEKLIRKSRGFGLPRQAPVGARARSFPRVAGAGRGLMPSASHVYSQKSSGGSPPGRINK